MESATLEILLKFAPKPIKAAGSVPPDIPAI